VCEQSDSIDEVFHYDSDAAGTAEPFAKTGRGPGSYWRSPITDGRDRIALSFIRPSTLCRSSAECLPRSTV